MRQTILTGLRTNAEYHLGNYIGAILPMVQMARQHAGEYQINLFAPDLHSFTTPVDHASLYQQTMHNIRLFVACGFPLGLDSADIYRQSRIPAHSELTVILNNFAYMGELGRMTQFKEKNGVSSEKHDKALLDAKRDFENVIEEIMGLKPEREQGLKVIERLKPFIDSYAYKFISENSNSTAGLFDYPVLMAADILLYKAQWIPVGEDQRQHLEFTRDLAMRFNNKFGETFTVPKPISDQQQLIDRDAAPRIRSLRDPSKKMSKSVDDPAGTIQLSDTPEAATKKIMGATTDNVGAVHFDWDNQPGVTNLLQILALLSDTPQSEVNTTWEGRERYGDLKKATAEVVAARLEQIQTSLKSVNENEIEAQLQTSEAKMAQTANDTLAKVQKAVGLR